MDNRTKLWIRACKRGGVKRCESIVRRFYVRRFYLCDDVNEDLEKRSVANSIIVNLSIIVDKYCDVKTVEIMSVFVSNKFGLKNDKRTNLEKSRDFLVSKIANTKTSKFIGLNSPKYEHNNDFMPIINEYELDPACFSTSN